MKSSEYSSAVGQLSNGAVYVMYATMTLNDSPSDVLKTQLCLTPTEFTVSSNNVISSGATSKGLPIGTVMSRAATFELINNTYLESTELRTNLGEYTLISGTYSGSGATYFSGLVGAGVDHAQVSTNYYSNANIVVFQYKLNTVVPNNAVVRSVSCQINGHPESTSNTNEYMCVRLKSGNEYLSDEYNFKSSGVTANTTVTLNTYYTPTASQLSSMVLECRLGRYGGAINGATLVVDCGEMEQPRPFTTYGGLRAYFIDNQKASAPDVPGFTNRVLSTKADSDIVDYYGASFNLRLVLMKNGTAVADCSIQEGDFFVSKDADYGNVVVIHTTDKLYKTEKAYYPNPEWEGASKFLNLWFEDVCNTAGLYYDSSSYLLLSDTGIAWKYNSEKVMTCRELLGYLAMIVGGNVVYKYNTTSARWEVTIQQYSMTPLSEASERTQRTSYPNYRMMDDGTYETDSNYKLVFYDVSAGELIHVISDYKCQFQERVAAGTGSGISYSLGKTYGAGEFDLLVPDGATCLAMSTTTSNSQVQVTNKYDDKSFCVANWFTLDNSLVDVTVTGVKTVVNKKEIRMGSEGYVVLLTNPIFEEEEEDGSEQHTATIVGEGVHGDCYVTYNGTEYITNGGSFTFTAGDTLTASTIDGTGSVVIDGVEVPMSDYVYEYTLPPCDIVINYFPSDSDEWINIVSLSKARACLSNIYDVIANHPFRIFNGEIKNFPFAEFMDAIQYYDVSGSEYISVITSIDHTINGTTKLSNTADSPLRVGTTLNSSSSQIEQIQSSLTKERNETQKGLQEERERARNELDNAMANSYGLYSSVEIDEETGASTWYLHDKSDRDESDTVFKINAGGVGISTHKPEEGEARVYQYGFTSNGNAIMEIISSNYVLADWIKAGRLTISDPQTGKVILDVDTGKSVVTNEYGESTIVTTGAPSVTINASSVNISATNTSLDDYVSGIDSFVSDIESNGVSQVTTGKGYSFSDSGLIITGDTHDIQNKLDETGMQVLGKNSSGQYTDILMKVTYDGVQVSNLTAPDINVTNTMTMGKWQFKMINSTRMGCFYVG